MQSTSGSTGERWQNAFDTTWLEEATVDQLQTWMQSGRTTAEQIVKSYMYRMANLDKRGPAYNTILEWNPDAIFIAQSLDLERRRSGPRGPLHGIPVLLKDNINTGDLMHTSGGSLALADARAYEDAFLVRRLREAGAVILGKANMTEFANFMAEEMPSGYSSRGGQVHNPYGPGRFDVGGSSSGSAAAVAANLTMLSVGTETSGSILNPAVQNAVVGIKPTIGLISRSGVMPISFSQDTAGSFARTVADAARLLDAMMGIDPRDTATLTNPQWESQELSKLLDIRGLEGVRLGVCSDGLERAGDASLFQQAVFQLEQCGAVLVPDVHIPTFDSIQDVNVLVYEFKAAMNAYLSKMLYGTHLHTLADLISYHRDHARETLKYGQYYFTEAERTSGTLTEPAYLESRLRDLVLSQRMGIDTVLETHQLDAIVFARDAGADIAARAGYPSIAVPAGFTPSGEPFGITFTGAPFTESALIRFAYAFEQATMHRRKPPTHAGVL